MIEIKWIWPRQVKVLVTGENTDPALQGTLTPLAYEDDEKMWRMFAIAGGYEAVVWMPGERVNEASAKKWTAELAANKESNE